MKRLAILGIILILCSSESCNNHSSEDICPNSYFNEVFPKRSIDLSRRLGNIFKIEKRKVRYVEHDTLQNGNVITKQIVFADTIQYKIEFNKKTRENTIVRMTNNDTLFSGLVSYYKGYYYMSEQINDSSYWIGAMAIDYDSIQAFCKIWDQMCELEDTITNDPGNEIVLENDTIENSFRLSSDKKLLRGFYPQIVDNYPKYKIVSDDFNYQEENWVSIENKLKSQNDFEFVEDMLVVSLYPNPASEFIQIDFREENKYVIQLIDNLGKVVLTNKLNNASVEISLSNLQSGYYILRVSSSDNKLMEHHRLLIL